MRDSKELTVYWTPWPTAGAILVAAVYLIIAGTMPVSLLMYQGYDDGLFIRLASNIAQGDWLGPYDQMTLVKGPGYPLFLALNSFTGIPINIAEPGLYLISCLIFAYVSLKLFNNRKWTFFLVIVCILLCPSLYISKGRITREFFYASISLATIALWINITICNHRKFVIIHSIFAGIILFIFWITREEAIWIIPPMIVITIFAIVQSSASGWRKLLGPALANATIALLSAAIFAGVVKSVNLAMYGSPDIVEMTNADFQRAMRQLQRVGALYDRAYLPVPKEAREKIYAVSTSYASLRDYLEGRPNTATCKLLPETCGDIAGGWFMWALRDAAAKAGYHASAESAAKFYGAVAEEISSACSAGRLVCASYMLPLIPHVTRQQWDLVPDRLIRSIRLLYYAPSFTIQPPPSVAHPQDSMALATLNYPVLVAADGTVEFSKQRLAIYELWKNIIYLSAEIMRYMIPASLIIFIFSFVSDRDRLNNPIYYVLFGLMAGIASRVVIMILVDISSFPTIYYPRFTTTNLLAGVAAILAVAQGIVMLENRWQKTRARAA